MLKSGQKNIRNAREFTARGGMLRARLLLGTRLSALPDDRRMRRRHDICL
jgi:hypothetical protein